MHFCAVEVSWIILTLEILLGVKFAKIHVILGLHQTLNSKKNYFLRKEKTEKYVK